jgi:hypothetical protein
MRVSSDNIITGIQVQSGDADAAETADLADHSWCIEPSSTSTKQSAFGLREESSRRQ